MSRTFPKGRKQPSGSFEARGSDRAQLPSSRSRNSSRTLSGTLHRSRIAFSTSFLCTHLKSLNPLSLKCSSNRQLVLSPEPPYSSCRLRDVFYSCQTATSETVEPDLQRRGARRGKPARRTYRKRCAIDVPPWRRPMGGAFAQVPRNITALWHSRLNGRQWNGERLGLAPEREGHSPDGAS